MNSNFAVRPLGSRTWCDIYGNTTQVHLKHFFVIYGKETHVKHFYDLSTYIKCSRNISTLFTAPDLSSRAIDRKQREGTHTGKVDLTLFQLLKLLGRWRGWLANIFLLRRTGEFFFRLLVTDLHMQQQIKGKKPGSDVAKSPPTRQRHEQKFVTDYLFLDRLRTAHSWANTRNVVESYRLCRAS